jgi:hypothetical protein
MSRHGTTLTPRCIADRSPPYTNCGASPFLPAHWLHFSMPSNQSAAIVRPDLHSIGRSVRPWSASTSISSPPWLRQQ